MSPASRVGRAGTVRLCRLCLMSDMGACSPRLMPAPDTRRPGAARSGCCALSVSRKARQVLGYVGDHVAAPPIGPIGRASFEEGMDADEDGHQAALPRYSFSWL